MTYTIKKKYKKIRKTKKNIKTRKNKGGGNWVPNMGISSHLKSAKDSLSSSASNAYNSAKKLTGIKTANNVMIDCTSKIDQKYVMNGVENLSETNTKLCSDPTVQKLIKEILDIFGKYNLQFTKTHPLISSDKVKKDANGKDIADEEGNLTTTSKNRENVYRYALFMILNQSGSLANFRTGQSKISENVEDSTPAM